jgi:hypothetical protein
MDSGYGIEVARIKLSAITATLVNEVQSLTPSAAPDSGAIKIVFTIDTAVTKTTASIAFDATNAAILAACIGALGTGNCTVSGTWATAVVITFAGDYAAKDMAACTVTANTLKNGVTAVTITVHEDTKGVAGGGEIVAASSTWKYAVHKVRVHIITPGGGDGYVQVGGANAATTPVFLKADNVGVYEYEVPGTMGNQNQNFNTSISTINTFTGASGQDIGVEVHYHKEKQFS